MTLQDRIDAFSRLGHLILTPCNSPEANRLWDTVYSAHIHNPWFTPDFCRIALESIAMSWLNNDSLNAWISSYPKDFFETRLTKNVAVIMAGNVPLVGFHDFLCVLITSNSFTGKISSKDGGLMQAVVNLLQEIEPRFEDKVKLIEDQLTEFDAVIATGSNNSARYFDFYFGKYPNIIRKNRNSLAVLTGSETEEDLKSLTDDIFLYFGLGCRNVSKLFVPHGYDFDKLFRASEKYASLKDHHKYANNYDYHRTIYLMNQVEHLDNGFLIIKPDYSLESPVSVLFYEHYDDLKGVKNYISMNNEAIQCVISVVDSILGSLPYGQSQKPALNDYADGIDTIKFLQSIQS